MGYKLVLGSASPRRQELLRLLTPDFEVRPADVDETLRPGVPLADEVVRLSLDKAR
ncbi:Maf family protein, partial [Intestinibacillus massiliensis]|uniref:Maf family protein n=1 Tax=Intestinibacillus massiliensis TaxID=1871029 RepID=UPI00117B8FBF